MKRSASACYDKEATKDSEPVKKITKSVQTKKAAAKPHDDIDEFPSPVRLKTEADVAAKPLEPRVVNDDVATEKERAAARAARIRLGYEKPDATHEPPPEGTAGVKCPTGAEPQVQIEVEYLPTADLTPLDDVTATIDGLMTQLSSKDWLEMCAGLNAVRRLTVHHASDCLPLLPVLVPAALKLLKNPRSSVSKTSVLCFGDLLHFFKSEMQPHLNVEGLSKPTHNVLCQLLLKSSTDKLFLAEEVQKVLTAMAKEWDAIKLAPMLMPFAVQHKNPKVRGKAGSMLAKLMEGTGDKEWREIGLPELLRAAAALVTDKTPDAREASRSLILQIHSIFHQEIPSPLDGAVNVNISVVEKSDEKCEEEPYLSDSSDEEEQTEAPPSPWQLFCEAHLNTTQVMAVLKVQGK